MPAGGWPLDTAAAVSWLLGTSLSPSWEAGAALGVLRGTEAWGPPLLGVHRKWKALLCSWEVHVRGPATVLTHRTTGLPPEPFSGLGVRLGKWPLTH